MIMKKKKKENKQNREWIDKEKESQKWCWKSETYRIKCMAWFEMNCGERKKERKKEEESA